MRFQFVVTSAAILLMACSARHAALPPVPDPALAEAFIDGNSARFTFPAETASTFTWHRPSADAHTGSAEYLWEVDWEPPDGRLGLDPDGVSVSVYWRPGGPRTGDLSHLVATASRSVDTFCPACPGHLPASAVDEVAWVKGEVVNNRVIVTIRGRREIARVFPVIPDSVRLKRYSPEGWPDGEWTVAVRRRSTPSLPNVR